MRRTSVRIVSAVMRFTLLAMLSIACSNDGKPTDSCGLLFGTPIEATGLGANQCGPTCSCSGVTFAPPTYDEAFIQALVDDWRLAAPFAAITVDPYTQPVPPEADPASVCAVVPTGDPAARPRTYELAHFPSLEASTAAGAFPTQYGACGVCSTLDNLAVYMRDIDLGTPVRACGVSTRDQGHEANVACLMGLGFDRPCAQIWAYNTANTRSKCLTPCFANFNAPYNLPDGELNECLACDETESGPVFKAIAGRTRRNSGLPNAICRPCSEVRPLIHDYPR